MVHQVSFISPSYNIFVFHNILLLFISCTVNTYSSITIFLIYHDHLDLTCFYFFAVVVMQLFEIALDFFTAHTNQVAYITVHNDHPEAKAAGTMYLTGYEEGDTWEGANPFIDLLAAGAW